MEYKKSAEHANADALSRLESGTAEDGLANIFWISYLDELPVTAKDIASATRKDPVLACAYDLTLHGWPKAVEDSVLQLYVSRKQELSADLRCLLWACKLLFLMCIWNAY